MAALLAVRRVNQAAIERWSAWTWRRARRPRAADLQVVSAAARYGQDDLPEGLFVPAKIPSALRLPLGYVLPYYGLASLAFEAHLRAPISREVAWDASARVALRSDEGWGALEDDATFAAMRLQGSNPFLLAREGDGFVANYGPSFEGIAPPVRCSFLPGEGGLRPTEIRVGEARHRPGEPGWEGAKRLANALDARYTVFGQHLLRTHLITAQAFALASAALPDDHPLAGPLRLHTHGSLHVNHYAWRLLFSPTSYFVQSRFIARGQLLQLVDNERRRFRVADGLFPEDAARRGLHALVGHPWVEDAGPVWAAIAAYGDALSQAWPSDAALRDDAPLRGWHDRLRAALPTPDDPLLALDTRADLARLLAWLVFNNVVHEVSGDYANFLGGGDADARRIVNFEAALRGDSAPPVLGDVFLFEQGAFAGLFNTAGNNLMGTPVDGFLGEPRAVAALAALRARLAEVEVAQRGRDAGRTVRFLRMRPSLWEFSVSF